MTKLTDLLEVADDVHIHRDRTADGETFRVSVDAGGGHIGQGDSLEAALKDCLAAVKP